MNQIQGVYVGNQIWGSSFQNGEFVDEVIDIVSAKSCHPEYATSDINMISGNVEKEVALAYYAYSKMIRHGKKQERVYEIICGDDCIEMCIFEGLEEKCVREILHQKEETAKEDSEKIIIGKWILEQFYERYPEDEEIIRLKKELEDIEYSYLIDEEVEMSADLNELLKNLHEQIHFCENEQIILWGDKKIAITKARFESEVTENLIEIYIPYIKKVLARVNNNLGKDDVVYIYAKDRICNDLFAGEISNIAKENCVSLVVEIDEGKKVSRGNAYLYYLRNFTFLSRIKENLGRYEISYYDDAFLLESDMGETSFECVNDFTGEYDFKLVDAVSEKIIDIRFLCPFSKSGNRVSVQYCFEATGLKLIFKDVESNEEYQKTIEYSI